MSIDLGWPSIPGDPNMVRNLNGSLFIHQIFFQAISYMLVCSTSLSLWSTLRRSRKPYLKTVPPYIRINHSRLFTNSELHPVGVLLRLQRYCQLRLGLQRGVNAIWQQVTNYYLLHWCVWCLAGGAFTVEFFIRHFGNPLYPIITLCNSVLPIKCCSIFYRILEIIQAIFRCQAQPIPSGLVLKLMFFQVYYVIRTPDCIWLWAES
jgi:hypothetical protein